MADEGKKISFGFAKTVKKPLIKNAAPVEEKAVDYIEFVDDKAIKIIGNEEKKNEPLVIPMLGSKTWHDRIINKVDADIFEPKNTDDVEIKEDPSNHIEVKKENDDTSTNGNGQNESVQPMEIDGVKIKDEPNDPEPQPIEPMTLEQQAAQEILSDLKAEENKSKEQKAFTVPIADDDLKGKEESTLEDYDKIPIEAFGMAMLRGMGWKEDVGVGKNAKVVAPAIPELRPKGMGLGADKLAIQKVKAKLTKEEENLKIVKGCCVRVIAGKKNGSYGKIEGLDEETGRILVRLALGNEIVSLVNELMVQPVTNEDYSKNSKVINMKAYEEHKNKDGNNGKSPRREEDSDNDNSRKNKKKSKKKSRSRKDESDDEGSPERKSRRKRDSSNSSPDRKSKNKRRSPDNSPERKSRRKRSSSESSPERKSRKKRDSSDGSDDYSRRKNSKKSKKHKSRDSSAERSSRKNKKKDKEREKSRHKKSDYPDASERARNRDRRSRSYSPKNCRRNRSRSYSPKR